MKAAVAKAPKTRGDTGLKKKAVKRKVPLEALDVDEFMRTGGGDGSDDGEVEESALVSPEALEGELQSISASDHKKALSRLAEKDPEFYKFLQQEDKELLDFDVSDEESSYEKGEPEGGSESSEVEDENEVGSEDEPTADDSADLTTADTKKKQGRSRPVTLQMVRRWAAALKETGSDTLLQTVIAAFKAAVQQTSAEGDEEPVSSRLVYSVEGSAVFNAIVRLCLTQLLPTLASSLKLPTATEDASKSKPAQPSNSKHWSRFKVHVKSYLQDVVKLVTALPGSHILNPVLKHVNQLVAYFACFPKLSKVLVKRLTHVWSTGEETPRVLAFLSVIKLIRLQQSALLEPTIKIMYLAYVRNTKFTSPSTLPLIAFMQRSMVELLALDHDLAYQHAFVYIRQLAIHLRNAIVTKKKESYQTVYNWQFLHSLGLWARLVSVAYPSNCLQQLIYPLVQVITGAARLIPTAKFYPLRFHCVRLLNMISAKTRTFIPALPLLLEVLQATDFNKKFTKASVKPFDFSCMLKLSKAQLQDRSFKDGCLEQLYELILDHMHMHAHCIGFPELVLPAVVQMRAFTKKCKVAVYCRQVKQLIEKAEETSRVINQRRSAANFSLADFSAVDAWEARSKEEGTPMSKYWSQWQKIRDRETAAQKAAANKAKPHEKNGISQRVSEEPAGKKSKTRADDSDDESDYSDLNSDELEELAKSADEESADEESADEESGEEEEEVRREEPKQTLSSNKGVPSAAQVSSDDDDDEAGDVVEDFEWSESEEEST